MIHTADQEVQKTVEEHITRVPGVRGAVVVAADGLALCGYAFDDERVEYWAAMAASLMGLARRAVDQAQGGGIRRLVVDMHEGQIVLSEAGADGVLLVVVAAGTPLSAVAPEVEFIAGRLRAVLGADPNTTAAGGTS